VDTIDWYGLAYVVGTAVGFYIGRLHGITVGSYNTIYTIIQGGFVKTRTLESGELDLVQLPPKDRTVLDD